MKVCVLSKILQCRLESTNLNFHHVKKIKNYLDKNKQFFIMTNKQVVENKQLPHGT